MAECCWQEEAEEEEEEEGGGAVGVRVGVGVEIEAVVTFGSLVGRRARRWLRLLVTGAGGGGSGWWWAGGLPAFSGGSRRVPLASLGRLWGACDFIWRDFGVPLTPFGVPLGSLWLPSKLPLAILWDP